MKKEIVRKLTSLILMTIMFAGGLTFAFPNTIPEASAAHNANLIVSAESTISSNTMTGPMVVQVIVSDSAVSDIDDAMGEPDVTVNGLDLRMVQANDGNWYAYIADVDMAKIADDTQPGIDSQITGSDNSTRPGKGLNFGKFCKNDSGPLVLGFSVSQTEGIAIPSNATFGPTGGANVNGTDGIATFVTCTGGSHSGFTSSVNKEMKVVRENKTVNSNAALGAANIGQIGLRDTNYWPFIQLYDFTPTGTVTIAYTKSGGTQTTTLTFDSMSGQSLSLDRSVYPSDANVHLTLTDLQLNIDPTDEDSWTWGSNVGDSVSNKTVFYMLFNDTGARDADGVSFDAADDIHKIIYTTTSGKVAQGAQNLFGNLTALMFEDNGMLTFNNNTQGVGTDVIELQDNTDVNLFTPTTHTTDLRTNTINGTNLPITVTETEGNTGIFTTTDESDVSNLKVNDACISGVSNVCRGRTATITYNDISYSITVGTSFATLNMDETGLGGEWNSGETIDVTLVDNDANLNSRVDEDLDVFDKNVKIWPAITIGSPITLAKLEAGGIQIRTDGQSYTNNMVRTFILDQSTGESQSVDTFSAVARFGTNNAIQIRNGGGLVFNLTTTGAELETFLANGTVEGTSTDQNGVFHYLNYDLRSIATNATSNILAGAKINFTIYDQSIGDDARISGQNPHGGTTKAVSRVPALDNNTAFQGLIDISNGASSTSAFGNANEIAIAVTFTGLGSGKTLSTGNYTAVLDLFRFGTSNDGDDPTGTDRFNDAIYRLELEETGDNTGTFIGTVEYIMLNQLNINATATYTAIAPISNDVTIIVQEDLTDEDAVRINYNDLAGDGTILPTADQQSAPTHSGVVSFDFDNYKIADTVTVTLTDQDLNVDSEVIDVFTVVTSVDGDPAYDAVGTVNYGVNSRGDAFGRLLDITFDDQRWIDQDVSGRATTATCAGTLAVPSDDGLGNTGFTLVESGIASGVFTGSFAIPSQWCSRSGTTGTIVSATGKDMEVNYVDYRDASGEIIEVGDGAGIRANTGSVSLDRTVYPVPWATITDYTGNLPTGKTPTTGTTTRSLFPLHESAIATNTAFDTLSESIGTGDVVVHVRVNDPDFNPSGTGSDSIAQNVTNTSGTDQKYGPVKITVQRGNSIALLATAGGAVANTGVITNGATVITSGGVDSRSREIGPISEIAPDAGIFELDFTLKWSDGPLSTKCPTSEHVRYGPLDGGLRTEESDRFFARTTAGTAATGQFAVNSTDNGRHCIVQGDILQVEYTDPSDASGNINTVTDSATFDLRNGVLQSDKSVYIIGSDMILTLIEPDFDRDNDAAETYDLDLVEWDSDASELTMGDRASIRGSSTDAAAFDPEPSNFRETGDSTGIFQIVVEIPNTLNSQKLDRGEKVELEYSDWGPSGADFVGEEKQDVNLVLFTSNFGATVELDQKVYTWTDKVFITIVAPDHNFDSNLVDDVGETSDDKIIVQTRTAKLTNYKLSETGTDTGIFTGEVILTGFVHDADGDATNDITSSSTQTGSGPTDGKLSAKDNDGLTVSFEFNEDETVVGSALIRWNIGEVSWLEASYPATGTGVVRIVDPDMNLNPEAVDNFKVDVWSDSDSGGIDLTVSETNEATGIFEGTVFFTITDESSGHRLRVAEGDTITAEYEDNTLPEPYTTADELEITGTAIIGTIVPPLERAPASNARVVDAFGNSLTSVSVDQQVQIASDLSNGQDRDQKFAYLVQIQDASGVTVSLAWITGSLTAGQSFSPALSWIPDAAGTYTATVFVWESVDNPTALSPTVTTTINVS